MGRSLGSQNMEQWACMKNIERMRAQLAIADGENARATLKQLLAEEEARLKQLASAKDQ